MHTFSEIALVATIWSLTGIGAFFALRARLRKKKRTPSPPESKG
ncbi:MAG: hypothetical protein WDA20_12505 [Desulfuromonadales bacterium]